MTRRAYVQEEDEAPIVNAGRKADLLSIPGALADQAAIYLASVIVSQFRIGEFTRPYARRLLRPALIHCVQTPLRTGSRCAHRLAAHYREHRVGVPRRQH